MNNKSKILGTKTKEKPKLTFYIYYPTQNAFAKILNIYLLVQIWYNDSMKIEERMREKKRFSALARLKSTNHAWRGLIVLISTTHNLWVHIFFGVLAVYLGFLLNLSSIEWMLIIFAIFLVIIAETFNTAIEIDIDLTSPEYHPYAKDTKDVSAAAVTLAVLLAGIIGIFIFLPKIFAML